MMKKLVCMVAAALVCVGVQAQEQERHLRWFGTLGAGFGGDELASGTYTNGQTFSIKAGSGTVLSGGISYPVSDVMDVQASLGYQSSTTNASNGEIKFNRMPVELLGFYNVGPQWRVGAGLRSATSPKLTSSGAAGSVGTYEFTPSVGGVLELQYLLPKSGNSRGQLGFSGRWVNESFEENKTKQKISGNHFGLAMVYYY